MQDKLFELASAQGIWAMLSIALIFYVLRAQERRDVNQESREEKYQKIILGLTENLDITKTILEHISDIKNSLK